ncbi:MAG: AsmA family protein [Alphaproteobacteria bacterium]|nr:AsmA family protein [Alphaproteobacteria bacterium]
MLRLFKHLITLVLIIIVGAVIGGWYFMRNFNLNSYKSMIENQVYSMTGREFKINGNAHLGISLIPTLIVEDITLANAAWAEEPNMLTLKKLEIELAILPLLKKQVVINSVDLIEPKIYLEQTKEGMNNWTFTPKNASFYQKQTLAFAQLERQADQVTATATNIPLPDYIQNISLKNITIKDGYLIFNNAGDKQDLTLKNIDFSMDSLDSPITAEIDAIFQNQPISANLTLGSANTFLAENTPFPIDINAKAFNIKAAINGALFDITKDLAFDVNANIYSPSGNFNLPETTLIGEFKGTPQQITAEIQTLNIANNDIKGTIKANLSQKIPHINAALKSNQIDLRTLQKGMPLAADFSLISSAHAAEYIPNTPIPYEYLHLVNGNLKLVIGKLIIDDAFSASNVDLIATLNNGLLNIKPLKLNFGNGAIDLNATLNAKNQTLSLVLNSKDVLLQDLHKEFIINGKNDFGVLSGGKTTLFSKLTSQGKTYRQLIQNLNGQTIIIVSASKIQTGALQFTTANLVKQLLNVLKIDTSKSSEADLQCAVIRTDIANGKAVFPEGVAIQSNKMTLSGNGNVNLINDKIDFSISPAFNLDTGIAQALSSLIKIQGTVEQPKIKLDDKQALKTVVGIATTGGAAYLGSQALLSNNSPCYSALSGTSYQSMVPQPSAASKAQQNTIDGTKAAYKETKENIKQELKAIEQNAKDIINMFKRKK